MVSESASLPTDASTTRPTPPWNSISSNWAPAGCTWLPKRQGRQGYDGAEAFKIDYHEGMQMSLSSRFLVTGLLAGAILVVLTACTSGNSSAVTPAPTADIEATVDAAIRTTIAAWPTATPRPTYTPYPTPPQLPTPDIPATVDAGVQARITARPTATHRPTHTPYPAPTAIPRPTVAPRATLAPTPAPTTAEVDRDRAALVAFYNSAGGPQWINDWNWTTDQPLGKWNGITTDRYGRVIELTLNDNNLTGTIPPELGNLANLKTLYFAEIGGHGGVNERNKLTGTIPPELGNLTKLELLALNTNELTGHIPPELGNLVNLRYLGLGGNSLTGPIPPELGNLLYMSGTGPTNPSLGSVGLNLSGNN